MENTETVVTQLLSLRKMVKGVLGFSKDVDMVMSSYYKSYTVQVTFDDADSLIVIRIAKLLPNHVQINDSILNNMNDMSCCGSHVITSLGQGLRCYNFKMSCWLSPATKSNVFRRILDEGCIEADRGFALLTETAVSTA